MTLMEKYKNRKPPITKDERDAHDRLPKIQSYCLFLGMCERLENEQEYVRCATITEAFNEIEKRSVYVFDIVQEKEYEEFKKAVIKENVSFMPIGKPDRVYDLNNKKDYADWRKLHPNERITF